MKQLCDGILRIRPTLIKCMNLLSHCIVNFSPKGSFGFPSILQVSIPIVVNSSSQEKMTWINAGRIIAMVKNANAFWNFPFENHPRHSMGIYHPCSTLNLWLQNTVSLLVLAFIPFPTITILNSFLKSIQESLEYCGANILKFWLCCFNVVLHVKSVLMCRASGCSFNAGASA
jgi:hypothetical protein